MVAAVGCRAALEQSDGESPSTPMIYLLNTDTLITIAKERCDAAARRLHEVAEGDVAISVVSLAEMHFGLALTPSMPEYGAPSRACRASCAPRRSAWRSSHTMGNCVPCCIARARRSGPTTCGRWVMDSAPT